MSVQWPVAVASDAGDLAPLLRIGLSLCFRTPLPLPESVPLLCRALTAASLVWSPLPESECDGALVDGAGAHAATAFSIREDAHSVRLRARLALEIALAACGIVISDGESHAAAWASVAHIQHAISFAVALARISAAAPRVEPVLEPKAVRTLLRSIFSLTRSSGGTFAAVPLWRCAFGLQETPDSQSLIAAAVEIARESSVTSAALIDAACMTAQTPTVLCDATEQPS